MEGFNLRAIANWRWMLAAALFALAMGGFMMGVSLTERPDVSSAGWLTQAYYSLGLFVVGGLDLGTPTGGPMIGRVMLWIAYFGCPALTASAVIEAALKVMSPRRWRFRQLRDHVVIDGTGELTRTYLRLMRAQDPDVSIVVVDQASDYLRDREFEQSFGVSLVVGDLSHEFLIRELRVGRARRVVLSGDDDFHTYECASQILRLYPTLAGRIVLHCSNLRFLRSMENTRVAQQCLCFNGYQLAATSLVTDFLIQHFHDTAERDVVVLAGFGRFGQTVLEELQRQAPKEVSTVAVIDLDATRRMLVAEEQQHLGGDYTRLVLQGDVRHPGVWQNLSASVDLNEASPAIVVCTGNSAENLRAALWLKQLYPNAVVLARTNDRSDFALEIGAEHDIVTFSIRELVEDHLPEGYLAL